MAKQTQNVEFMVEDLIIEGILAGIFRTCDAVDLTPFGEWLIRPFKPILEEDGYATRVVEKVFAHAGKNEMPDTDFLQQCVETAADREDQDSLLNVLNRDDNRQKVTAALGAASVQFGVFLCLCSVYCRLRASEEGVVKAHDGKLTLVTH